MQSQLFTQWLVQGCEELGLEMAAVSRVEGENYSVVELYSVFNDQFGLQDARLADIFCAEVVEQCRPVYFPHSGQEERVKSLCDASGRPADCYVGVPVFVKEEFWGTLSFSSPHKLKREIDIEQLSFVEAMAARIGWVIEGQERLLAQKA